MPDQTAWYILQVNPGKERQIKEKLDKRFHTQQHTQPSVQIVVPVEALAGSDEAKNYAGVVLIQLYLEPDLWTMIHNTPGVTGYVGMGVNPTPFQVSDWKQIPLLWFAPPNKV